MRFGYHVESHREAVGRSCAQPVSEFVSLGRKRVHVGTVCMGEVDTKIGELLLFHMFTAKRHKNAFELVFVENVAVSVGHKRKDIWNEIGTKLAPNRIFE